MKDPLVQLTDVEKTFRKGQIRALRGVSLTVCAGDSLAIVGPSGSGKSTMLLILGAMDRPTSGSVRYGDRDAPRDPAGRARLRARQIGFVFQSFHLLPNLTALENVQVPLFGVLPDARKRKERARDLLARVGLDHRMGHRPAELSGGEQQRVAIARALANDPPLILADEPTGNLDSKNAAEILDLLLELHHDRGLALVVITHESSIADRLERRLHLLDGRLQPDSPE